MRRTPLLLLPALLALPALAATPAALTATTHPRAVPAVTAAGLDAMLNPTAEPGDEMLGQRSGVIPTGAWQRANSQSQQIAAATAKSDPGLARAAWSLKGPTNIGGRVLDVVVDPLRRDSIYLATASGGVWHSTDGGKRFASAWPTEMTQAVGALAISKTGVLWAGTGEAGPGGGSITYGGSGVYRSADGGKHWTAMGLNGSERIGRVVIDPRNEKTIWVAANGPLYSGGGVRGLYKTTDGGKQWKLVLKPETATAGAVDIALDPRKPDTVYTTTWDRIRYPDKRQYTGLGSGAFKSTDGGKTWTRIGGPTLLANPELGRLGIAVAPSNPNRVYILASTEAGLTAGMYRSDDAGATFTPGIDTPLVTGGYVYAWWFGRVYVDPKNPDHVFATGVNMSESTDGGVSFGSSPGLHSDQHAMAWDPKVPGRVYVGNDGGFYRSDNNGASFKHGEYMPWNQLFSIDVSQQDPRKIVGGLQDNGGNRNYKRNEDPSNDGWNDITGGDGTEMTIDPRNDKVVYGCSQYGACAVSTDGGTNMTDFSNSVVGTRKGWLTPIEFDPGEPHAVYTGSEIVSRSTDDGKSWTPISPDLTGGPGRETNPLFRNYGTITTLAVAYADLGTIYAGTDDGRVQYTHDAGTTWTRATGLPSDWVTSVAIDRRNAKTVAFASFSGFRSGKKKSLVYRTADGGKTWKDISGNLPQAPVNDVVPVGDDLLAATDVGVFLSRSVSKNHGRSWLKVGSGLPNAPVTELRWHAPTSTLFAANFGRGAWSVRLSGIGARSEAAPAPVAGLSASELAADLRRAKRMQDLLPAYAV
ncbi:MAG: hypothetical protein QOI82_3282 [Actinomycetota bacterium]|jgi:photosystem II stability/assembly factor-like uncharacterized protein|nr:hypothetical protein [Actinomycetota bacterium]